LNPFRKFKYDVFKKILFKIPSKSFIVSYIKNILDKKDNKDVKVKNLNDSIIINKNKKLQENVEYDFNEQIKSNKNSKNKINFPQNLNSENDEIKNDYLDYMNTNSDQRELSKYDSKQDLKKIKEKENIYSNIDTGLMTQIKKRKINEINLNHIQSTSQTSSQKNLEIKANCIHLTKKNKYKLKNKYKNLFNKTENNKKQLSFVVSSFFSEINEKKLKKNNTFNETKSMENSNINNILMNGKNNPEENEDIKFNEMPDLIFSNNLKKSKIYYTIDFNENDEESNIDKNMKINIHPNAHNTIRRNSLTDRNKKIEISKQGNSKEE